MTSGRAEVPAEVPEVAEPLGVVVARHPATKRPKRPRRRKPDPIKAWIRRLDRTRPNLVQDVLDALAAIHGHQVWQRPLDPTSLLVLTILTQNTADTNAEKAFLALRRAYPTDEPQVPALGPGWGGEGLPPGTVPDWAAIERAPVEELIDVIRPGGLAPQKAPRIQASLRRIREERGDYSLEFLGDMPALEARAWLTGIGGIGKKTASIVLLFSFNLPLMPVDRHVERVSKRIGLIPARATADEAHEYFLALLRPDQMYEAHINLIRHGRLICTARSRPTDPACPITVRCRYHHPDAP